MKSLTKAQKDAIIWTIQKKINEERERVFNEVKNNLSLSEEESKNCHLLSTMRILLENVEVLKKELESRGVNVGYMSMPSITDKSYKNKIINTKVEEIMKSRYSWNGSMYSHLSNELELAALAGNEEVNNFILKYTSNRE